MLFVMTDSLPSRAATIVEVTGRLMDVNGHTDVPRGLFGVHALKLTPELVEDWGIECFRQIHFVPGSGSIAWDRQGRPRAPFKDMPMVIDCQGWTERSSQAS